jgi:hypothetical protein
MRHGMLLIPICHLRSQTAQHPWAKHNCSRNHSRNPSCRVSFRVSYTQRQHNRLHKDSRSTRAITRNLKHSHRSNISTHQASHCTESVRTRRTEAIQYKLPILTHSCTARLLKHKPSPITIHKRLLSRCSFPLPTDGGCWGCWP